MYNRDFSVPQAIKEIIVSNDFYLKAIKSGIVNYTALANKIHKDVESITLSSVNIGTIIVAIKRFADELIKNDSYPQQATSNKRIMMKSTEPDEQKNQEPFNVTK